MRRRQVLWLGLWLLFLPVAVSAACPLSSPHASPTPIESDDGIGGSGFAGDDPDPEDGIGGSGVVRGTITGFGSICINGMRIPYADDVPVTRLDEVVSQQALAVGQVVSVRVEELDGQRHARAIEIQYEAVGPLDTRGDALQVVAQPLELLPAATGDALSAPSGARVAVSGLRQPDGRIAVTRLDFAEPSWPDALRARVETWGPAPIVGGVEVDLAGATRIELSPGDRAWLRGRYAEPVGAVGRFEARRLDAERLAARPGEWIDVEGYVTPRGRDGLELGGVELGPDARSVDGARPRAGERARIRARMPERGRPQSPWIQRVSPPDFLPPRPPAVHGGPPRSAHARPDRPAAQRVLRDRRLLAERPQRLGRPRIEAVRGGRDARPRPPDRPNRDRPPRPAPPR